MGRSLARAEAVATVPPTSSSVVEIAITTDLGDALRRPTRSLSCATAAREPLFSVDALPQQVHVNGIGSFRPTMRELPDELLANGLVIIDDRDAVLEESGEISTRSRPVSWIRKTWWSSEWPW